MSLSPTALTLRRLREDGWPLVECVEHWNSHAGIRQDLFGIIDVIAVGPAGTVGVQATTTPNVSARVKKIAEHPSLPALREANWFLYVWGWAKVGRKWELTRSVDVS